MVSTRIISAICTPLRDDYSLDVAGLEAHIDDQWRNCIGGLLVGGTMGLMQLQSDSTYRDLVEQSVRISRGRGELMVGVGDTSFARTRDRIQLVERFAIDAIVVLSPYLVKFSQNELIDYYRALADLSTKPMYLYDLPIVTGIKLELDTVTKLADHPNIHGIKCSTPWDDTRQLFDRVGDRFRIIPAQPHLVDLLVRIGIRNNLDGIFSVVPRWLSETVQEAESGNWEAAAAAQQKISWLLHTLRHQYTVFGGCEAILSACGILNRITPAPLRRLNGQEREQLLAEPYIQELLTV